MIALDRRRPIARGGLAALLALVLSSVASAVASSPTDWRTATRVSTVAAGDVHLITGGQLTSQVASGPPAGADLRALTVERAGNGYSARVFFSSTFQQVDSFAGQPISHAVFISLRPPGGDELQVQLLPGGKGKIQRIQSGQLTDVATASPTVDGDHVTLPIPASLSPKPDWEIQGHVIMLRQNGSGFHKHTKPALIGALTGEAGRIMSFPTTGIVIEKGRYLYWKHVDMPAEARAKSFRIEHQKGKLVGVLTLAAPFKLVSTINGKPVDSQGAQLTFFASQDSTVGDLLYWDAPGGKVIVVDLHDPQNPRKLGETVPSIKGDQVVFDLSLIPLPSSLKSPSAARGFTDPLVDAAAQEPELKFAEGATSVEDADGNGVLSPGFVDALDQIGPQVGHVTSTGPGVPWLLIVGLFGAVVIVGGTFYFFSSRRDAEKVQPGDKIPIVQAATASEFDLVNQDFREPPPGTITPPPPGPPQIQINVPGTPTIPPSVPWPGTDPPPLQSTQGPPAVAQESAPTQEPPPLTFRLRPGLKWSEGTPVTAKDVADSMQPHGTAPSTPDTSPDAAGLPHVVMPPGPLSPPPIVLPPEAIQPTTSGEPFSDFEGDARRSDFGAPTKAAVPLPPEEVPPVSSIPTQPSDGLSEGHDFVWKQEGINPSLPDNPMGPPANWNYIIQDLPDEALELPPDELHEQEATASAQVLQNQAQYDAAVKYFQEAGDTLRQATENFEITRTEIARQSQLDAAHQVIDASYLDGVHVDRAVQNAAQSLVVAADIQKTQSQQQPAEDQEKYRAAVLGKVGTPESPSPLYGMTSLTPYEVIREPPIPETKTAPPSVNMLDARPLVQDSQPNEEIENPGVPIVRSWGCHTGVVIAISTLVASCMLAMDIVSRL